MDKSFFDIVLDEAVDCVRFQDEKCAVILYTDGTNATIVWKDTGWRFACNSPPYDAATATGMYD